MQTILKINVYCIEKKQQQETTMLILNLTLLPRVFWSIIKFYFFCATAVNFVQSLSPGKWLAILIKFWIISPLAVNVQIGTSKHVKFILNLRLSRSTKKEHLSEGAIISA